MKEIVTSPSNSNVKLIKSLHIKKYRDKCGLYLVEGIKMVKEALNYKNDIYMLVFSQDLYIDELGLEDSDKSIPRIWVDKNLFNFISDVKSPQGIMAVIKTQEHFIDNVFKQKTGFWVILDRVQDPGNMGTIIRTVDAVGASGVILFKGCVDPYSPKTIRSTMGSIFRVPTIEVEDTWSFLHRFILAGGDILVSSMEGDNIFTWDVNKEKKLKALVIGNESQGISDRVRQFATNVVSIPIIGEAESLNASVAAGIMIYEIMRKKSDIG